jgi:hypothetical protein
MVIGAVWSSIFASIVFGAVFSQLDWTTVVSNPEAFSRSYLEAITTIFTNPVNIGFYVVGQIVSWCIAFTFYVLFFGVNARAVRVALDEGKIAPA